MGKSRQHKIKTMPVRELETDVFFMSLEEARRELIDKYEFLEERQTRAKRGLRRMSNLG